MPDVVSAEVRVSVGGAVYRILMNGKDRWAVQVAKDLDGWETLDRNVLPARVATTVEKLKELF